MMGAKVENRNKAIKVSIIVLILLCEFLFSSYSSIRSRRQYMW
jgi:hypothetical protein